MIWGDRRDLPCRGPGRIEKVICKVTTGLLRLGGVSSGLLGKRFPMLRADIPAVKPEKKNGPEIKESSGENDHSEIGKDNTDQLAADRKQE